MTKKETSFPKELFVTREKGDGGPGYFLSSDTIRSRF